MSNKSKVKTIDIGKDIVVSREWLDRYKKKIEESDYLPELIQGAVAAILDIINWAAPMEKSAVDAWFKGVSDGMMATRLPKKGRTEYLDQAKQEFIKTKIEIDEQ